MTEFPEMSVRAAVDESIRLSSVLLPVDSALVASARTVADRIDAAVAAAEGQELTKALYLIPHVTNLLKEMLATPAARAASGSGKESGGGKLAQLRSIQGGKAAR